MDLNIHNPIDMVHKQEPKLENQPSAAEVICFGLPGFALGFYRRGSLLNLFPR